VAAEFYPPMTYSPLWSAIGVVIVLGVLGWALVIWAQTRPARVEPEPELPPGWWLAGLKEGYLERIDEINRLHDAGELSARRAHQELSVAVRDFVHEASGVPAPTMTLAELRRSGDPSLAPVSEIVRGLYPVEFGPDRPGSVRAAAGAAREVVARWT
jgi:hypothetical protein